MWSVFGRHLSIGAIARTLWYLILRAFGQRAPSVWDKTTADTARYGDADLDPLRSVDDPSADAVVIAIMDDAAAGQGDALPARILAGEQLLNTIRDHDLLDPAHYPPFAASVISAWMAQVGQLPPDLDDARLRRASDFFTRYSFLIALVFASSSLLEAYACPKGVRSLASTDYLIRETHRRLAETMQWVLLVEDRASWTNGTAAAAMLKIRLMHATIRQLIYLLVRQKGRTWNIEAVGVPICGEDLLGMLMGFAAVPVRDLPQLGVDVTLAEAEDHLYLWRVVGRFLGVDERLMPRTLAEAKGLIDRVKERQQGYGPEGHSFALALLAFHASIDPGLERYALRLMRDLVGQRVCDFLGIDATEFPNASLPIVPRPRPLIQDVAVGVLRTVLRDPLSDRIGLPQPGTGGAHFRRVDVPGTGAARAARAALTRRRTAELWGQALLSRRKIETAEYSRERPYVIPDDMAARWDAKHKGWRDSAERLARRVS
ncbi:MAG TPA: oxygenase MpaB family protein [Candidatus Limnocylindria bacterium]|nr:oxygenase MpaB family protein [Candidatus Limnocylindria bacterium]